jgi:hypothetical protein
MNWDSQEDANLLALAQKINRGINKKVEAKEGENATKWRKLHSFSEPIKIIAQLMYVL